MNVTIISQVAYRYMRPKRFFSSVILNLSESLPVTNAVVNTGKHILAV